MNTKQSLFVLNSLALTIVAANAQEQKKPNVIYIMSDDHAVQAISAYGHPVSAVAPTPNIDRIANEGVLFNGSYCGNSISGPSRAAVITGKHSHANGFKTNSEGDFNGEQLTMPKVLQQNGYETAIIGKWHLGGKPTGFDHWMILNGQGQYFNPVFITDIDTTKHTGYATDLITDYSIDWMEKQRKEEKPFFIMIHHKAPHRTWIPAPRHYYKFENTEFPVPETLFDEYNTRTRAAHEQMMTIDKHMFLGYDLKLSDSVASTNWINDGMKPNFSNMTADEKKLYQAAYQKTNDEFNENKPTGKDLVKWKYQRYMRDYCATITAVDENVGRILDYLQQTDLDENTIVMYTSDQGFYLGEHGWYDKRFMYEESMRMPLLMKFPKSIKPGKQTDALVQNIDYAPTILDFCGIEKPKEMHGVSFKQVVENGKPKTWRKSLYYRYYEYNKWIHYVMPHIGVKQERYKLIAFHSPKNEVFWELYDLKNDPQEMNNIYGEKGTDKITRNLKSEMQSLANLYNDTLPECITKEM